MLSIVPDEGGVPGDVAALVPLMPAPVVLMDDAGDVVALSAAAAELIGRAADAVIGAAASAWIHPAPPTGAGPGRVVVRTAEGRGTPALARTTPLDGGAVLVQLDPLRDLLAPAPGPGDVGGTPPDLLVTFDDDATILDVGDSVHAYGGGPDHYLGRSGNDIVHPEDLTALGGEMEAVLEGRAHRVVSVRLLAPDRAWRRFEAVEISAIGTGSDQVWVIRFRPFEPVSPDIQTPEEQFRSLASLAPIGIFSMAPDGRLLYANPYWVQLHGLDAADDVTDAYETVHPDDRDRLWAQWEEAMATRRPLEVEYRVPIDDATRRLRGQIAPRLAFTGKLNGWLGSIEDVTELRDAIERADEANRAKSRFLSRMSHELRTPLNAIIGFSQLLGLDGADAGEVRETAAIILRSGRHLLELIDEVLDISRIEAGELALHIGPVDTMDVVRTTVETLRILAEERDVRLEVVDGVGGVVRADRQRLLQVLLNLVSNAVKYNRRGGAVTITPSVTDDGRVTIAVADTGPGIAEEDLPRLFVPFDRLGAEGTGVDGTGIGLSIAHALVAHLGGELTVTSTVGVGTTFTVSLPASTVAAIGRRPTAPSSLEPSAAATGTVLCVEDNEVNARLIEQVLRRRPHVRLVTAATGAAALEQATNDPPDVILLDLDLPDIPGETVLARICDHGGDDVQIVVVTADASPGLVDDLVRRGATDVMTKPIDVTRMLAVIDDAMG